jgi:4-hydroxybenzoate polyprenyltransferase
MKALVERPPHDVRDDHGSHGSSDRFGPTPSANLPGSESANISGLSSWTEILKTWLDACRVHQWCKNTLVFVPLLTSHQFSTQNVTSAAFAFIAFSLCASAIYLLNDLVDLKADREHPRKRHRALASGRLSKTAALTAIPILLTGSAAVAFAVSRSFALILLSYLVVTIAYSFYLKRLAIVDIIALASFYTLRIIGGAVAIDVLLSQWLLVFSIFIFTSLALIKRYAELVARQAAALPDPTDRDYRVSDAAMVGALAAGSGLNAVTILTLYLSSPNALDIYSRPALLWLLVPLLIYWVARALIMAHRNEMHHDPVVFTFSDRASRIAALCMVNTVLVAI